MTDRPTMRGRVVVTGAAGMVGQNLVPRLLARGYHVSALDRHAGTLAVLRARAPEADLVLADLAEPGPWEGLLQGCVGVVDLKAQITSPNRDLHVRNNVTATNRLLAACRVHDVPHLIHLSSSVVISKASDFYTETKRLGENATLLSEVPFTILRPPLMFGPGDVKHLGLILDFMRRFPAVPVPGDGKYLRQPLHVGDLCAVIEGSLERGPRREVFNVIGHERIPFIDLLRTIRRVTGSRCVLLPIPMSVFSKALMLQKALLGHVAFTRQQLEALTAGDDFPVEGWAEVFGVTPKSFSTMAPATYVAEDSLRRNLLAATRAPS